MRSVSDIMSSCSSTHVRVGPGGVCNCTWTATVWHADHGGGDYSMRRNDMMCFYLHIDFFCVLAIPIPFIILTARGILCAVCVLVIIYTMASCYIEVYDVMNTNGFCYLSCGATCTYNKHVKRNNHTWKRG